MAVDYQKMIDDYKTKLRKSPTAYTPGVKPTASDLAADAALRDARNKASSASGAEASAQWYDDSSAKNTTTDSSGSSNLKKFLHIMGGPLYGVVGGVEAVLGRGTKKGLANIPANFEEQGTMGDLLRGYGVSNVAALPLGFALDMALDPVMWATAGTEALIPRVAAGAIKGAKTGTGAIQGAKIAAESGLLNKAEAAGRVVPNLTKQAFDETAAGFSNTLPTKYRQLSELAAEKRGQFDKIMGQSTEDILANRYNRGNIFDALEKKIGDWKVGDEAVGEKILNFLGYSPSNALKKVMEEENIAKLEDLGLPAIKLEGHNRLTNLFDDGVKQLDDDIAAMDYVANNSYRAADSFEHGVNMVVQSKMKQRMDKVIDSQWDDIEQRLINGDQELLNRFSEMGAKDRDEALYLFKSIKSGIDSYDRRMARIVSSPMGRKILSTYQLGIGLFKNAKIGGNLLSAGTNAVVGNMVMTSMMGVDLLNNAFWGSMKKAITMAKGGDESLKILYDKPAWRKLMNDNPETFFHVFGIDPYVLSGGHDYINKVVDGMVAKMGKNLDPTDLNSLKRNAATAWLETIGKTNKEVSSLTASSAQGVQGTTMVAEYMSGSYGNFVNKIKKMAEEGKPGANLLHWYLTKPMEAYGKVDQTYKFGLAYHLSENGISSAEIKKIAKRIAIGPDDYKAVSGRNLYKLTPQKAMEVANETYMNYAAMPGFVQMMRTLPIVGSPFISFTYGMMANASKTMAYNTAFFNKVQFLLREFSGQQSPLEKDALQGKYYGWLNQPGMVKLPFYQDNPVFLNMSNMIPYYTLNVFQPMERSYTEKFGDVTASIVDKSPFLKTPEGQIMFDYFIQPLILQNAEPKGMFNQQLFPKDAGALAKTGYIARQAAETVLPSMLGYAGLVAPTSEESIKYIPLYRWRQLAYARKGKTSVGATSKTDPAESTAKVMSAMAGWPLYTAKIKYNSNNK